MATRPCFFMRTWAEIITSDGFERGFIAMLLATGIHISASYISLAAFRADLYYFQNEDKDE